MAEYLIIAGSPRSGTSMLGSTLNTLPDVAVFAEFSITRILQSIEETLFGAMEDKQFAPWDPGAQQQFLRPTLSEHGTDLKKAIYNLVYPGKSPRILGNKIPAIAAVEDIDYLLSKIPNLKIIYLVRDCFSVIRSSMTEHQNLKDSSRAWSLNDENEVVDEWIYSLFLGRYLAQRTSVLFVKYEDLLSDPEKEAIRIENYLDVTGLDFMISQPSNIIVPGSKLLTGYSRAFNSMLSRWAEMNITDIIAQPLDAEFFRLCWNWRPLSAPMCDIGTHENFHPPEPWGSWTKPGYFALRPRFYDTSTSIAIILLHFLEKKALLEGVGLYCSIGSAPAEIVEIVDPGNDEALVVVRPTSACIGDGLVIKVFSRRGKTDFEFDTRQLGLRLKRYALLSSVDDMKGGDLVQPRYVEVASEEHTQAGVLRAPGKKANVATPPDAPSAKDLQQLYELAVYCRGVAAPHLTALAPTRESQRKLVSLLKGAIVSSGRDFGISKEFLSRVVMLRDKNLLGSWCASPEQLAWLMVHEGLSAFFGQYAIQRWDPEVFLMHHVPESPGAGISELLSQHGYFVAYPQTTFEVMCESYGLLGFSAQLEMFENVYRMDRIYIGGHYNLPDTVRTLGIFGRCQGVTLCSSPVTIVSSAVRSIWTRIENGDVSATGLYGLDGIQGGELTRLREALSTTGRVQHRMTELLLTIMTSAQFRAEFDEIYVPYFYNHDIYSVDSLAEYMAECATLFPATDSVRDMRHTLACLKVDGLVPEASAPVLSERDLFQAMGGAKTFVAMIEPRMLESMRIYDSFVRLRVP